MRKTTLRKRSKRRRVKRSFGHAEAEHQKEGARLAEGAVASARAAATYASQGNCAKALDRLVEASIYYGGADSHLSTGPTPKSHAEAHKEMKRAWEAVGAVCLVKKR